MTHDTRSRRDQRITHLSALLLSVTLFACGPGPDDPRERDAGTDANDMAVVVVPPDIPWLAEGVPPIAPPALTPCPEGWHEVVDEDLETGTGVVTCDPYGNALGATEPDTCAAGWAHFVGDAGCAPVGAPCPVGDFPEGLPTDVEVLYVLSAAPPGGDGTRGSPLSAITDALNLASAGTVVAIGKGEYDEALRLPRGVTLWGACAAETHLTASRPGALAQGVVTIPSAGTHLTNLRIGPAELAGLAAYGTGTSVSIDGVMIEGVRKVGLHVNSGAHVDGRMLVISGTRGDFTGHFGRGIVMQAGATMDLARVVLSENADLGVSASDEGTSLTLQDVLVRDTQVQQSDRARGRGIGVDFGATATITRALVLRNSDVAIFVSHDGTSLTLTDVVVRDTLPDGRDATGGRGLNVQFGAAVNVTRLVFSGNRELGAFASDEGTSLTLTDVVLRDTQAEESGGEEGRGLGVQGGATVTVARASFSRNREIGIFASGDATSLTLADVVVHDTQSRETDRTEGRGIVVIGGATVEVARALLSRNREIGVLADGEGTSVTLSDVAVQDTAAQESDGLGGWGLAIQAEAMVTVTRALLSRNRGFGVSARSLGTVVQLSDLVVDQTAAHACGATSCRDQPFGVGLLGAVNVNLEVNRFEVRDSALCGVMVAENGEVYLSDGEVSGSQIGVCLQVDGYPVSRLTDGVRYVDNVINLDATSLPVPDPVGPVDETR